MMFARPISQARPRSLKRKDTTLKAQKEKNHDGVALVVSVDAPEGQPADKCKLCPEGTI